MAAPQFSVPKRVTPSRPIRRFTLEQANRSLPLVSRIVSDIVHTHSQATTYRESLEHLTGREAADAQHDLDASVARLETLVDELTEVGVELKDYSVGLVDFIGRHENRDVYLCWKLGEGKITHWHETNAGFAGRKPITMLREK